MDEIPVVDSSLNLIWITVVFSALVMFRKWFTSRALTRSWQFMACAVLVVVALVWLDRSEIKRGLFILGFLLASMPIAHAVYRHEVESKCSKFFVVGCVVSLLAMIAFQDWTVVDLDRMRLGHLYDDDGYQIINPNDFGTQMVLATLLGVWVFEETNKLRWLLFAFLTGGAILYSASRSAVLVAGLTFIAYLLTRLSSRLIWVLGAFAVALTLVMMVGVPIQPLELLIERFTRSQEVVNLGNRAQIIQPAFEAWTQNAGTMIVGVGPGGTWKAVGARSLNNLDTKRGEDGIARLHTHNGYLEWVLSFGALGTVLGLMVLIRVSRGAVLIDRKRGDRIRVALLTFGLAFSITGVLFVHRWWIAFGSLFLALIAQRAGKRLKPRKGDGASAQSG